MCEEEGRISVERERNVPAVLSNRQGPPSTTFPSVLTRIKSEALRSGHATPNGLTQKLVGSTGSYFSSISRPLSTIHYPLSNIPQSSFLSHDKSPYITIK
jgi:hypothetical protein